MRSRDFVYWLQGFFEIEGVLSGGGEPVAPPLASVQVACIRRHLDMVFKHEIDPSYGDAAHQAELTAAHGGGSVAQSPKPQSPLIAAIQIKEPGVSLNC